MEKRTIEVSLAIAKEWYKGDNDTLKELALQAFSESELKSISCVRSWEEFCKCYDVSGVEYFINHLSNISTIEQGCRDVKGDKNLLATKEDAEAFLALIQLKRLRDQWWESLDWKPDYTNYDYKHTIVVDKNKISISSAITYHRFLAFPTCNIAEDFLNCFKDLIEIAKELI